MPLDWKIFTQRPYIKSLSLEEQIRLFNIANEKSIRLREQRFIDFANSNSTSQGASGDGDTGYIPYTSTKSFQFDRVSDYIGTVSPGVSTTDDEFTFSYWFNSNNTNNPSYIPNMHVASIGGGQVLTTSNRYDYSMAVAAGGGASAVYASNGPLNGDVWHQNVYKYHNNGGTGNYEFWTDGVQIASGTRGGNVASTYTLANLFAQYARFLGFVDEISFWDTYMESDQIVSLYNSGKPGDLTQHADYSDLLAWWKMGENATYDAASSSWTIPNSITGGTDLTTTNSGGDEVTTKVAI